MKILTAIPITELARLAGSKRKVALLAGLKNLGSINKESVLINGVLYCPSKSTADWQAVWGELVGKSDKRNVATEITIKQDPHPFDGRPTNKRLIVKLENGGEVIYKIKDDDGSHE